MILKNLKQPLPFVASTLLSALPSQSSNPTTFLNNSSYCSSCKLYFVLHLLRLSFIISFSLGRSTVEVIGITHLHKNWFMLITSVSVQSLHHPFGNPCITLKSRCYPVLNLLTVTFFSSVKNASCLSIKNTILVRV